MLLLPRISRYFSILLFSLLTRLLPFFFALALPPTQLKCCFFVLFFLLPPFSLCMYFLQYPVCCVLTPPAIRVLLPHSLPLVLACFCYSCQRFACHFVVMYVCASIDFICIWQRHWPYSTVPNSARSPTRPLPPALERRC